MALHDVDPNTTNRIEPMPQASDQSPTRSSDGTTAITNKQDGSSGAYVSTKDATVKVNDGTDNRVVMGLLPDGSYGLKVSSEGTDVLSAADSELIFNSGQNVFKIVATGTATIPAVTMSTSATANGQSSVVIAHGQSSVPAVLSYIIDRSGKYQQIPYSDADQLGWFALAGGGAAIYFASYIYAQTDATNVTFTHYATNINKGTSGDSRPATTVRYYILQETAN